MLSLSVCLTSKQNSLPERQQKIYSSIWNLDSPNLARCKINSHAKSPSFTILQLIHSGFRRFNGYSETKAKIIQSLDPAYCSPNGNANADVIQKQRISDSAFSFIVQMVSSALVDSSTLRSLRENGAAQLGVICHIVNKHWILLLKRVSASWQAVSQENQSACGSVSFDWTQKRGSRGNQNRLRTPH